MKTLLATILFLLIFDTSFAQTSEKEVLKTYDFYVEQNMEMENWSTKYLLSDGLISAEETYWKNELRSRTEFEFDRFGNVEREITTYDINVGKTHDTLNFKLTYNGVLLISKEFSFGMTEKYTDFNQLGKPKQIERIEQTNFKTVPYKELMEYDNHGNNTKSIQYSTYIDLNGKPIDKIATTYYKYDDHNNVIEIHREYKPTQQFPIPITGGPMLYEYEHFSYKYNKNGLWTKKYKTVNGKEYVVAKRKYK